MTSKRKENQISAFKTYALENEQKHNPNTKENMASDAAIREAKYWVDFNEK